jgi:hypothetical protein
LNLRFTATNETYENDISQKRVNYFSARDILLSTHS